MPESIPPFKSISPCSALTRRQLRPALLHLHSCLQRIWSGERLTGPSKCQCSRAFCYIARQCVWHAGTASHSYTNWAPRSRLAQFGCLTRCLECLSPFPTPLWLPDLTHMGHPCVYAPVVSQQLHMLLISGLDSGDAVFRYALPHLRIAPRTHISTHDSRARYVWAAHLGARHSTME